MFNKEINKAYLIGLLLLGTAFLSILIMVIIYHNPKNDLDYKKKDSIQEIIKMPQTTNVSSLPIYKLYIPQVNPGMLNQEAYSEAYLFKHEDFAQAINNYCSNNAVTTLLARSNCDAAFKLTNPLYFIYLLFIELLGEPKFWGALVLLWGFILMKKMFTRLFTPISPSRQAKFIETYYRSSVEE